MIKTQVCEFYSFYKFVLTPENPYMINLRHLFNPLNPPYGGLDKQYLTKAPQLGGWGVDYWWTTGVV
jgi:hypothetical protein